MTVVLIMTYSLQQLSVNSCFRESIIHGLIIRFYYNLPFRPFAIKYTASESSCLDSCLKQTNNNVAFTYMRVYTLSGIRTAFWFTTLIQFTLLPNPLPSMRVRWKERARGRDLERWRRREDGGRSAGGWQIYFSMKL